jgi:hypothetical protein
VITNLYFSLIPILDTCAYQWLCRFHIHLFNDRTGLLLWHSNSQASCNIFIFNLLIKIITTWIWMLIEKKRFLVILSLLGKAVVGLSIPFTQIIRGGSFQLLCFQLLWQPSYSSLTSKSQLWLSIARRISSRYVTWMTLRIYGPNI